MGPRAGLDGRKVSSPPGFDPGQSTRSQSLYRLSYPAIYICLYFLPTALDGALSGHFAAKKNSRYPVSRRLEGPQSQAGHFGNEKKFFCFCRDSNPGLSSPYPGPYSDYVSPNKRAKNINKQTGGRRVDSSGWKTANKQI